MKYVFAYEDLSTALVLMTSVVANKSVQEEARLGNFYVSNGKIMAIANSGVLITKTEIPGEVYLDGVEEKDSFVAILLKELNSILDRYKGLQRTKVTSITLDVKEHCIVVIVHEEPKSDEEPNADFYRQDTKFKLTKLEVKEFIKRDIPSLVIPENSIEMKAKDLQLYLDYFYPPMSKPKDPVMLHFKPDYVCAVMGQVFAVMMKNELPKELFQNMSLSQAMVGFLRSLLPTVNTFKIYKNELAKDEYGKSKGILLNIEIGNTIMLIKTVDMTGMLNITPFIETPKNQIMLDKLYLIDALKRVDPVEPAYITIDIDNASMTISTLRTIQKIPVVSAVGEGTYSFTVLPDHLTQLIFSHITKTEDEEKTAEGVLLCLKKASDGRVVSLTCKDASDIWATKYPRAQIMEAPKVEW